MSLPLRQIPNLITSIRILLVAPIAVALAHRQLLTTIALFGAAALSDAADGYLAKRYDWQTELGAMLDPLADKLLLATVFITLAYLKLVPLWLMVAAVARDVIIVIGALLFRYCIGPLEVRPRSPANSTRCVRPHSSWRWSAERKVRWPPGLGGDAARLIGVRDGRGQRHRLRV